MLRLTRTERNPGEEQERSGAALAVVASIGAALCCGLLPLVAAGGLTAVGAWLQNPVVIGGGLVSLLALIVFRSRPHG